MQQGQLPSLKLEGEHQSIAQVCSDITHNPYFLAREQKMNLQTYKGVWGNLLSATHADQ